ncbi:uncharacterized protein ARMOST_20215 [Armillaria ostoyae]|uniref:Uncharacterized protein n=1 Tax=Armillaria ostoyae TaxID=47428 RepID=A0A284S6U7_ARMOS|nr:uncharacterized protein ARMOST_20215 [Armillaria ostoyae]
MQCQFISQRTKPANELCVMNSNQQYLEQIISLPDIIDINPNSLDTTLGESSIAENSSAAPESSPSSTPDQYDIDATRPAPTVSIEDVEDEESDPRQQQCYMQAFPEEKATGATYGTGRTLFEKIHDETVLKWGQVLGPFKDDDEWQFAKWIIKHVGHNAADELLQLNMIQNGAKLSFKRKDDFLARIDQLPEGVAWNLQSMKLTELELWWHDPVEVIKDLMGNPAFHEVMKYAPEKLFEDVAGESEVINEMWTAEWWWKLQEVLPFGTTISAWPVYLTIGNISKEVRREASSYATVLIGYLPVGKFDCYTDKARQFARYQLFHHCMSIIMKSVAEAGRKGTAITCTDGFIRNAWPILAAYVADYPEQCLIACCKENRCPICTVTPNQRGENCSCPYHDLQSTLDMLKRKGRGKSSPAFNKQWEDLGLRPVFQPFWQDLPFLNIFQVFTPDLLHQLHKGVFKDHLVQWCMTLIGKNEMDKWFRAMVDYDLLYWTISKIYCD